MLHLTVGSGNSGKGGDAKVLAGATSAETGGSLTLHAGYGSKSTSGSVGLDAWRGHERLQRCDERQQRTDGDDTDDDIVTID